VLGRDAVYATLQRSEHVAAEIFTESVWAQQHYAYEIAASRQELAVAQRQLEMAAESASQLPKAIASWQGEIDARSEREMTLTDEVVRFRSAHAQAESTLHQALREGQELLQSRQYVTDSLDSFRHEMVGWQSHAKAEVDTLCNQLAQARNFAAEMMAQRDAQTTATIQDQLRTANLESRWQHAIRAEEMSAAQANQTRDSMVRTLEQAERLRAEREAK